MRVSLVETFHFAMNECFIMTVRDMLGSSVTGAVCQMFEENGINRGTSASDSMRSSRFLTVPSETQHGF
jgi:hypothetical protein